MQVRQGCSCFRCTHQSIATLVISKPVPEGSVERCVHLLHYQHLSRLHQIYAEKQIVTMGVGNKQYRFLLNDAYMDGTRIRWPDIWEQVRVHRPNLVVQGLHTDEIEHLEVVFHKQEEVPSSPKNTISGSSAGVRYLCRDHLYAADVYRHWESSPMSKTIVAVSLAAWFFTFSWPGGQAKVGPFPTKDACEQRRTSMVLHPGETVSTCEQQ